MWTLSTCPSVETSHQTTRSEIRPFFVPLAITASLLVLEVAGGLWTGSLALLADAGHVASDAAGLLLAMFAAWLSQRPPDEARTFGYHRVEVLAALANAALLWLIIGMIVHGAFQRLAAPPPVDSGPMSAIAAIGLFGNLAAAWALYRYSATSLNVRGAFLHVLADALGSVGALAAGLIILKTGWRQADPLASLAICVLVAFSSWGLVRDAVHILLEGVPAHLELDAVRKALQGLEGVSEVHDLHLWSLSSGTESLSAHLVVPKGTDSQRVLDAGKALLEERFALHHVTLQIEAPKAG